MVHCDGANIKNAYLDKGIRIRTLKKIIRRHNKYLRDKDLKIRCILKIKWRYPNHGLSDRQLSDIADELVKKINEKHRLIKQQKRKYKYKKPKWRKFLVREKKKKLKW